MEKKLKNFFGVRYVRAGIKAQNPTIYMHSRGNRLKNSTKQLIFGNMPCGIYNIMIKPKLYNVNGSKISYK
jgi:hypothetical protein